MKNCVVKIKGDTVMISARKGPLGIRLFLWLILIINLLAPIIGAVFFLSQGDGPHLGIFLAIGLTWLIGFYLLRIIMWNTAGKELISLGANQITYVADYKWFKGGENQFEINEELEVIANTWGSNENFVRLLIQSGTNSIESVLDISNTDFLLIENAIKTRYNMG